MGEPTLELNRIHVIEKIPGTQQFRLTGLQPAMQLRQEDEVVWIQRGMLFDNGGKLLKQPPAWFKSAVAAANPRALAECGYRPGKE